MAARPYMPRPVKTKSLSLHIYDSIYSLRDAFLLYLVVCIDAANPSYPKARHFNLDGHSNLWLGGTISAVYYEGFISTRVGLAA